MKNRPVSTRSKKRPHAFTTSVKTLFASGLGLVGIGSLLLFTFFVSTDPLQQSQDTRSDASVVEGAVKISQTNTQPKLNEPYSETLRINTGSKVISKVTLLFDVITDTTDSIEVVQSNPELEYSIEVDEVDHGSKVLVTVNSPQGFITTDPNQQVNLIKVTFTPTEAGPVAFVYDREKSQAIVKGSNPPDDQLTHLNVFSTYVEGDTPPEQPPQPEDFVLLDDNLKDYFKFYEVSGSRNEVDPSNLVEDRTYTVRHVARVQNSNEDELAEDPIIINQLTINDDETVTRTFRRTDLTRQDAPIELVFETTFEAKKENEFQVAIDSTNVFSEVNENNNSIEVRYTSDPQAKGCNERCDSNADCKDNYACHQTSDGKRCRRADNLSSSSCSREQGNHTLSCNASCSSSSQCAEGLTCASGQCRNPYDTNNTSCVTPSAQVLAEIAESCGTSCSDNRGCANNMRCFNGSCRLATNPSSTSCTAATAAVVTKGYTAATPAPTPAVTATPRPTTTPVATSSNTVATPTPTPVATATPTPTPSPTPVSQPNESVLDTLFGRLSALMSGDTSNGTLLTTAILPIAIIGAGILLLIMAIVIVLKPAKRSTVTTTPTIPVTTSGTPPLKPEVRAQPNPKPPPIPGHGVIMPKKSGGYRANAAGGSKQIENPDIIEMPTEPVAPASPTTPAAAPVPTAPSGSPTTASIPTPEALSSPTTPVAPTPTPSDASKPSQSMIQRLKDKGIEVPDQNNS